MGKPANTTQTRTLSLQMPKGQVETRLVKESVNLESRTVRMILTTEKKVRSYRWKGWDIEEFNEVLSMEPGHMRTNRLDKGAVPLLNSHRRWDLKDTLGVLASAEHVNGRVEGLARFSKRADAEEIFQDVVDGILVNGSIGYRVHRYEDISEEDDKIPTLRAVDWELIEMSLVPVGADESSGTFNGMRSEGGDKTPELYDCEILLKNENQYGNRAEQNPKGDEMKVKKEENAVPETNQTVNQADMDSAREQARKEERERVAEIKTICRAAKLGEEHEERFIKSGMELDKVRKEVIDMLAKAPENETEIRSNRKTPELEVTQDETVVRREGMVEAIQIRAGVKGVKVTDKSLNFRHMRLIDMARVFAGKGSQFMSQNDAIYRALSTSDFPYVLLDAQSKELQREYNELPQSFGPLVRRVSLSDFKAKHSIRMGDFPELKKKSENGELQAGSISEGKESFKLDTYGRTVMITRETIINDDLDAFSRVPQMAARRARQKEGDLVFVLITGNPTMADAEKLFSAAHKNVSAAQTPSVAEIGKLVALLRVQKGLDGGFINVNPSWLVGPTALESTFATLVNQSYVPTKASDINPWNKILKGYVVDPRFDAASTSKWYVTADVADIDMIELGTLDGMGPQTNLEEKFGSGLKFEIIHDVGAGLIDHRGFTGNGTFS